MNALIQGPMDTLPVLIDRATRALESARTSAEVLEAKDMARVAYDAAKSASRILRAKEAHDSLVMEVHRSQGHAVSIHARAEIRLAEEYNAAQEKGEARKPGDVKSQNAVAGTKATELATEDDVGGRNALANARALEKAEKLIPGIVKRVTDDLIERGLEPTMTAVRAGVKEAVDALGNKPQQPTMKREPLWVWGRVKDFERDGILEIHPADMAKMMTAGMRDDMRSMLRPVIEYLTDLENIV
jgi:hypothetical protein